MAMLQAVGRAVLDTIYPPRCIACTEETDAPQGLCPACWRDTAFISGPTCRTCGVPLIGAVEGRGDLCEACTRHPPSWDRGAAAFLYAGAGRRMVLGLKHGDRLDMVRPLATWMIAAGRPLVAQADIVAPVPLHWLRLVRRRYNQSAELARAIARGGEVTLVADLLTRQKATAPQSGGREARAANQAGAFAVTRRHATRVAGRRILLIDDVLTTGATLSGCAEALKAAGATGVDVLVVARVAFEDSIGL